MNPLPSIATTAQLVETLNDLQTGSAEFYSRTDSDGESKDDPTVMAPDKLARAAYLSRFDPRVAQATVEYLDLAWDHLPLAGLAIEMSRTKCPNVLSVLLDFVILAQPQRAPIVRGVIQSINRDEFFGLFFVPLEWPNSFLLEQEVQLCAKPYLENGFLGSQSLLPHARWPEECTVLPEKNRRLIIRSLTESLGAESQDSPAISVADYRQACNFMVSTRQAQRDLESSGLKATGRTNALRYRAKARSKGQS